MNVSIIVLVILRIIVGSAIRWIFFFDTYLVYLSLNIKILTISMCLLGLVIGIAYIRLNIVKLYYFRYFIGSVIFKLFLYKFV